MFDLTLEEGVFLVSLARRSIETYLTSHIIISPPPETPKKLFKKSGVFVTLNLFPKSENSLRGCIGFPEPVKPLVDVTIKAAIEAATEDPRFPPVRIEEMNNIVVEVSVLTPPEIITYTTPEELKSQIKIGRDGLIVERGYYRGLLLPQVPVEYNWDIETFLSYTCLKAGLPPNCWQDPATLVYKFQALIFEETSPRGNIVRKEL